MNQVEDIFSSSESAIVILNDLLQYENLDAGNSQTGWKILPFYLVYSPFPVGTFSLDQTWQPLLRVLVGKLKWAAILAGMEKCQDFFLRCFRS
jgi:hypothetical protein